ncbi:hypothetical protein VKT23_007482 [Stygiomarasmius scandens]|uniref:C2H2-type domain-containing protein n=1 Tax=Marasmiellus scandens TaxID=2682957 RepID=A0ABR1JPB6_9AGAR
MKRHMDTHNKNKKSYHCLVPGCSFSSHQKSNFDTHMRTHTGEKTKHCPDCDLSFGDPASLTRHRKRRHGYVPNRSAKRAKNTSSNNSAASSSSRTTKRAQQASPDSSATSSSSGTSSPRSSYTSPDPSFSSQPLEVLPYPLQVGEGTLSASAPPRFETKSSYPLLTRDSGDGLLSGWTNSLDGQYSTSYHAYPKFMYPAYEAGTQFQGQVASNSGGFGSVLPSAPMQSVDQCLDYFKTHSSMGYEDYSNHNLEYDYMDGSNYMGPAAGINYTAPQVDPFTIQSGLPPSSESGWNGMMTQSGSSSSYFSQDMSATFYGPSLI